MVDTPRTLSALQTLLANNSAGDIGAQDLRDMLVSLQNDHGEIYVSSSAETAIATKDTWVEATDGTYTLAANNNNFSHGTNGRLQYDGNETRVFHISASWAMISAGSNKTYEIGIGVDGTVSTASIMRMKHATGADVQTGHCHRFISLATGSYLSMMIRNITDTTNATLELANLFAMGMLL